MPDQVQVKNPTPVGQVGYLPMRLVFVYRRVTKKAPDHPGAFTTKLPPDRHPASISFILYLLYFILGL
jgi:hypothetical protein